MDERTITLELRNDCDELVSVREWTVRSEWDYAEALVAFLKLHSKPSEDTSITIRFK